MRVFVLSSSFPRSNTDFAGRFVLEWCEVLHRAGHEVRVFTWGRGSSWEPPGIEVHRVRYLPKGMPHLFELGGAPDALEREPWRLAEAPLAAAAMLVRALGRDLPDLWVGHWFLPGGALARVCGGLTGRPSLVVGHSGGVHMLGRLPEPLRAAMRGLVVREGSTTVPSEALQAKVGAAADVLPMGFDPPGPVPSANGPDLLCFGRLVPVKGFDLVPESVAALDSSPRVHFAGDGPERQSLQQRCAQLGLDAVFHGWVDGPGKAELFPQCRIALFPSRVLPNGRHEGRPVSVLEVASMGVIPVLADWPGARELVVDPQMQIVGSSTTQAWSAQIARLLALAPRELDALREATIENAARQTWAAWSARWVEYVERISSR